jgi:hypothetical protein
MMPKTAMLFAAALWLHAGAGAAEKVMVEWTFEQPGQFQGWQANDHIQGAQVAQGVLSGRAVGNDPILEYQPSLNFAASPWQVIEIRLSANRDGMCQVFWSNTREGRYGGFSGAKTTDFYVVGDGAMRTYRLLPFWHREGKIVRLRLDLADGMEFALGHVRVVELDMPPAAATPHFQFDQGPAGWQAWGLGRLWLTNQTLAWQSATHGDFLWAPPVQWDASKLNYVLLQMAAAAGREGRIYFATDRQSGLHSLAFPIISDGQMRYYNVDMLAAPAWQGRILALGIAPTDASHSPAFIRAVTGSDTPLGPPQLKTVLFALDTATPRSGKPAALKAIVHNQGGAIASNLQAHLNLPRGLRLLQPLVPLPATLAQDEEAQGTWQIQPDAPGLYEIALQVTASHAEPSTASARIIVPSTTSPRRPATYVPPPQPVRGPWDVGVYYFPGWRTASQWHPVQRFPERQPVLGWYQEGLPEVADWHIKWAVEHGITFFAYDWYWVKGSRQLEHALHDGYFKARYRHLLKFCLLWANHNPPQTHSLEDSLAVTRHWITHYFQRPEYYRLEGKPVVIIFSPHSFRSDLGVEGTRRALAAMREECRRAGLPGLFLVACVSGPQEAVEEGYDAVTCYNWAALGLRGEEKRGPFSTLIEGYHRQWEALITQGRLPLMLPLSGGWDSRPWHGETAMVRFGRTPELFKQHLHQARAWLERPEARPRLLPAILIEAWNEWGEGSYIEPHQEHGFAYLDAIREVFTSAPVPHQDLAPVDVGLGPYDVPPEPPSRTAWTFAQNAEGWDNTMNCDAVKVKDGVLHTVTAGQDPALFGPPMQASASHWPKVWVRLRLTPTAGPAFRDHAQLFWRTKRWAESEASSLRFPVEVDGQWHDYELRVSENLRWRGIITRLRLDPANRAGVRVELDEIRLAN